MVRLLEEFPKQGSRVRQTFPYRQMDQAEIKSPGAKGADHLDNEGHMM